jgi:hypothetical protein
MKNFGITLALGMVTLLGLVIYTTPNGPERIVSSMIQGVGILLIMAGTSGLIVSLGFAIGYASRNALQHRTPVGTDRVVERIIERHTLDGRLPQAPQIMTLPGAFDQYPTEFGNYIAGARTDAQHQLGAPPQPAQQPIPADLDAIYQPAEW